MADIEDPLYGEEMSQPLPGGFQMPLHNSGMFPDNSQLFPDYTKDLSKFTQRTPEVPKFTMPMFGTTSKLQGLTPPPVQPTPQPVQPTPQTTFQMPMHQEAPVYKGPGLLPSTPEPEKPWGILSPASKIVSHPLDFAGNFVKDATENVKGIAEMLAKTATAPVWLPIDIAHDPAKYKKYLDTFMSDPYGKTKEFGSNLLHALINPYEKYGWDVLYEKPFTVLTDAAAVMSLAGAGAKGGAKLATSVGRLAEAERLANIATKTNEVARALDPIQWGTAAIKKMFGGPLESVGVGASSAEMDRLRASINAGTDAKTSEILRKIDSGELVGENAIARELASERGAKIAMPMFADEEGLVDRAISSRDPAGEILKTPTLSESLDFKTLAAQDKRLGAVQAQVEENLQKIAQGRDPISPIERQKLFVKFSMDATKNGQYIDAVMEHLINKGEAKVIERPEDLDKLLDPRFPKEGRNQAKVALGIPENWEMLPVGAYKKALENSQLAGRIFIKHLETGVGPLEAANRAIFEIEKLTSAEAAIKGLRTGEQVAFVPKYVANYFDLLYGAPGRLSQINDAILKYWKPAVTSLKPTYVPSVAASNAIMALMAGVNPLEVFKMSKLNVPPEIARKLGMEGVSQGDRMWQKLFPSQAFQGAEPFAPKLLGGSIAKKVGGFSAWSSWANTVLDTNLKDAIFKQSLKDRILNSAKTLMKSGESLEDALARTSGVTTKIDEIIAARERIVAELGQNVPAWREAVARHEAAISKLRGGGLTGPELKAVTEEAMASERLRNELQSKIERSSAAVKEFQSQMAELQPQAEAVEKAIQDANAFTGSKDRLSPFEQRYMTKLVPFYTYTKMISQLAFRLPFLRPKSYFAFNRMAGMINNLWDDPNTPDWVHQYVPIGFGANGQIHAVKVTNLAPFNNVRTGGIGEIEAPGIFNPIQNPIISIIYNAVGGIPQWSKKPVSPDEYSVRLGSGAVYKIADDGKTLKQVIAQPPLLKDVINQFPFAQFLDEILHPYMQGDRGYLFDPRPILGPDGKPKFPKEMWEPLISQFLIREAGYKPADLRTQYMKTLKQVRTALQEKIRYERDPDLKAAAQELMRDFTSQQEIRIKNH